MKKFRSPSAIGLVSVRGQAMIPVLIGATIGAVMLYHLGSSIISHHRAERGIASNLDMTEISMLFHLMTDTPERCAETGLVGLDSSSLFAPNPIAVPVSLSMNNWVGTMQQPTIAAGSTFGGTRAIRGLNLISVSPDPVNPAEYIGTLQLRTEILGRAINTRSTAKNFFVRLGIDPGNKKILSCSATDYVIPTPTATPAPTPTPTPVPTPTPTGTPLPTVVYVSAALVRDNNSSCEAPDGGSPGSPPSGNGGWLSYGYSYNATATCPAGYKLSGGGVNCNTGGYNCWYHNKLHPWSNIQNSYPNPSGNSWVGQCCIAGGSITAANSVNAICVKE